MMTKAVSHFSLVLSKTPITVKNILFTPSLYFIGY